MQQISTHGALTWLLALSLLVLGSGYGMHEPWAPDSPRFAAVARDMLATGDWLFPRVGGDLYADKPPIFFWLMAISIWVTGAVRSGFLLPSLVAGIGTVWLVFDLTRRLWDARTAFGAGLMLLATLQFSLQAHTAQIDGTLCFLTTLGLYGLLRHLLLGPAWGWYTLGGAACGLGVITKGVGFLPLLVLVPWAWLHYRNRVSGLRGGVIAWSLAPMAAVAVIAVWLLPVALASFGDPALSAYRSEILFGQTVDRYLAAEGHRKPAWYFLTNVIPWAWLPFVLLFPWLARCWYRAWRSAEARVLLPLVWALLVCAFFSLSSGKRGVYILPALPAMIIAAAPYLDEILLRRWPNRLAGAVLALFIAAAAYGVVTMAGLDPDGEAIPPADVLWQLQVATLAAMLLAITLLFLQPRRYPAMLRLGAFLMSAWLVLGWWVMPAIDDERSGRPIMVAAEARLPPDGELGIVQPKESLILQARGALTNFGHRRSDRAQELADAARWLAADPRRRLIVREESLSPCFMRGEADHLGYAHRLRWRLVAAGNVDAHCAAGGNPEAAIRYVAPTTLPTLWR